MILNIETKLKTEFIDVTSKVQEAVNQLKVRQGLCFLYVPHTTAAITINEHADPSVKSDILMILNRMVPWAAGYKHMEGNSPAHVKSSLIGTSETILVENGTLVLGTWQGIFFCEFDGPRSRKMHVKLFEGTIHG